MTVSGAVMWLSLCVWRVCLRVMRRGLVLPLVEAAGTFGAVDVEVQERRVSVADSFVDSFGDVRIEPPDQAGMSRGADLGRFGES